MRHGSFMPFTIYISTTYLFTYPKKLFMKKIQSFALFQIPLDFSCTFRFCVISRIRLSNMNARVIAHLPILMYDF